MSSDLASELQEVFRQVFNRKDLVVTPETTARDVAGWDSLKHIELIVSLEARFGVKFKTYEIGRMESVADLLARLREKLDR